MLIVGRTIADWRQNNVVSPNPAKPFTFRIATDGDTENVPWPRVISTIEMAESDVAANVPFRMTDELLANEEEDSQVGLYVEALLDSHRGKAIFGERCVIPLLVGGRVTYESDLGTVTKATIEWEGLASWRPA